VRVSLKSVSGVDSVDVSLAKGLAAVKMKPSNTTTLKQLQTAITKNGFTMKQSAVTVVGTAVVDSGRVQLKVSGSNEMLDLIPQEQVTPIASSLNGKSVLVEGVVPETAKGKSFAIHYRSITEQP
jgi:Heavy-metal-associated domain